MVDIPSAEQWPIQAFLTYLPRPKVWRWRIEKVYHLKRASIEYEIETMALKVGPFAQKGSAAALFVRGEMEAMTHLYWIVQMPPDVVGLSAREQEKRAWQELRRYTDEIEAECNLLVVLGTGDCPHCEGSGSMPVSSGQGGACIVCLGSGRRV